LQARGVRVQRAYLFGSHAKGYARADSDIDIAVISQNLTADWLDDFCFLTKIADTIDPRFEVIPFLPQDFNDDNPLAWEIKTTGIPLMPHRQARNKRTMPSKRLARSSVSTNLKRNHR